MTAAKKTGLLGITLYAAAMNFSIRWLATGAATGPVALPIWIAAAILFLIPLLTATLELSARFPEEGAIYAWTRETQGPFAGFLCGWLYWACNLPYFASLLFFIVNLFGRSLVATGWGAPLGLVMAQPLGAFAATSLLVIIVALMHARGFGVGKWLPVIGAAMSIGLLVFIIATGFYLSGRDGSATNFAAASYLPPLNANGAILWSSMLFAYAGVEGVALMRNEVKGGVKTVVRALGLLAILQTLGYAIGTGAMLMIVPQSLASRLGGLPEAIGAALDKLHMAAAQPVFLLVIGLSLLGGLSAWFGAAARLPFAVGVDRMLPAAVGRLDPTTGAPVVAIWIQALLTIAVLALSALDSTVAGAYDFVVAMGVITFMIPYLWMFAAYWIVQKRNDGELDFRTPGGKPWALFLALLGIIMVLSAIAGSLVPSPEEPHPLMAFLKLLGASAVMIAVGALIYGAHILRTRGQK
ncbi:APC family permease [Asticcacaulis taihuensis]|uniref:APC family permease n=1 Tax=Asticcacaulis taihuensis TaxID=260084 RepID=UPI0026EC5369|nr:APC family permease [Asticcacaulis taihuensis]